MGVDAVCADTHDVGYLLGGHAFRDMGKHFDLSGREYRFGRIGIQMALDFIADYAFPGGGVLDRRYELFMERARAYVRHVGHGKFGADMKVSLLNDGPVTIVMDSEVLKPAPKA